MADSFLVVAWIEKALQLEFARTNRCKVPPDLQDQGPTKVLVRATKHDYVMILRHTDAVD